MTGHATEILGVDRRKVILTTIAIVVVAGGALALLGQAGELDKLVDAVGKADQRWLILCLAGQLAAYSGYVLAYRDVARAKGGPVLSYGTVTKIVVAGFGANVVGSTAGTLAVQFWALRRATGDDHEAARRVLALNTLQWAILASSAAAAGAAVLAGLGSAPTAMALAWLATAPTAIAAALWVSAPRRASRLARREKTRTRPRRDGAGRWLAFARSKLRAGFGDVVGALVIVRHLARRAPHCAGGLLGLALYWTGLMVTLSAAVRAFSGEALFPPALVLAFATGYVATGLPLPAGGIGGIEASLAFSLNAAGIAIGPAVLAVLVYRLFTFWLPAIPAVLWLGALRGLSEELPGTRRERDVARR